jgi:hypothetical protein
MIVSRPNKMDGGQGAGVRRADALFWMLTSRYAETMSRPNAANALDCRQNLIILITDTRPSCMTCCQITLRCLRDTHNVFRCIVDPGFPSLRAQHITEHIPVLLRHA